MQENLPEPRATALVRDFFREDRLLAPRTIAGAGVAVFLALFGLEFTDPDPKTIGELFRDALELALAAGITTAIAIVVARKLVHQESRLADLEGDLDKARAEGGPWRNQMRPHIEALASAVQQQFGQWNLSDAEQDIGFLLLKGLSFKEIANIRRTNEGTVRQQATVIYRKSKLEGRTSLAAYFFEDMLTPIPNPAVHESKGPQVPLR